MYVYTRDTIINYIIHNYINCRANIVANIVDPFVGTIKWCVTFYSGADEYQWSFVNWIRNEDQQKLTLTKHKKIKINKWVRLNYATTHHHPPPPTTSENMSTTTHHQRKYVHHHPPPAKIYPPQPTTSHNISTTTYHFPKNGPPPRKSQNIFIYNLL